MPVKSISARGFVRSSGTGSEASSFEGDIAAPRSRADIDCHAAMTILGQNGVTPKMHNHLHPDIFAGAHCHARVTC